MANHEKDETALCGDNRAMSRIGSPRQVKEISTSQPARDLHMKRLKIFDPKAPRQRRAPGGRLLPRWNGARGTKASLCPIGGRDGKENRNQSSQFRKNYEERKKGVSHRDGCYLCGDPSHMYRSFPKLGKLGAMI
ncbi:hypothetical protein HAX54_017034 [Datura stramonium]|uniref:Uncharacterized protein n=1 Tax=Datura stramonium TaxID=4076 RepID=A0ABS8S2L0_DATST|nr:hypothetical protein [Datura stramonium]